MSFEPEVLAALIASSGSLLVAVLAWQTARRAERTQHDVARKLNALSLADAEFAPVRTVANALWADLQRLKQALDIVLIDAHPDSEDAWAAIQETSASLLSGYARQGAAVPSEIRESWHYIKNQAIEVRDELKEFKDIGKYDRAIPLDEKARFLVYRLNLTKSQRRIEEMMERHRVHVRRRYADVLRPGVEL